MADIATVIVSFIAALIVLHLLTMWIADLVVDSKIGFITSDGRFILNGAPIETLSTYVGQLEHDQKKAQLAPDKKLPAKRLLELVSELQSLGAKQIVIMTENESQ